MKKTQSKTQSQSESVIPGVVEQQTDVEVQKRLSTSLTAAGSRLTILAQRKANDTATVFVTVTDLKTNKATRGMTQKFESFDAACAALKRLVREAAEKGWKKTERSGGFKARPDAFTSMPAPASPAKQQQRGK